VRLLDVHEDTRTLHIVYLDPEKTLTSEEITPIRKKLLDLAKKKFRIVLKAN
jgi:phenylalanyl-tRNA synthetase beta subunit